MIRLRSAIHAVPAARSTLAAEPSGAGSYVATASAGAVLLWTTLALSVAVYALYYGTKEKRLRQEQGSDTRWRVAYGLTRLSYDVGSDPAIIDP